MLPQGFMCHVSPLSLLFCCTSRGQDVPSGNLPGLEFSVSNSLSLRQSMKNTTSITILHHFQTLPSCQAWLSSFLETLLCSAGLYQGDILCIVLISQRNSFLWPLKLLPINTHFSLPSPLLPQQTLTHAPHGPLNVKRQTPYPHIYSPMTP